MPNKKTQRPPQHQSRQPGLDKPMTPQPESHDPEQPGCGKLTARVAFIPMAERS
jgi:hypothetical protein